MCDAPLWAEGLPGKISQINPFPHDFQDLFKGVVMSDITDVKNSITPDKLCIPNKNYTSQRWKTNTLLLRISRTDANIFNDDFWSQEKYNTGQNWYLKCILTHFRQAPLCAMTEHPVLMIQVSSEDKTWEKSNTCISSVTKNTKIFHLIFRIPMTYRRGEYRFAKSTRNYFPQIAKLRDLNVQFLT